METDDYAAALSVLAVSAARFGICSGRLLRVMAKACQHCFWLAFGSIENVFS